MIKHPITREHENQWIEWLKSSPIKKVVDHAKNYEKKIENKELVIHDFRLDLVLEALVINPEGFKRLVMKLDPYFDANPFSGQNLEWIEGIFNGAMDDSPVFVQWNDEGGFQLVREGDRRDQDTWMKGADWIRLLQWLGVQPVGVEEAFKVESMEGWSQREEKQAKWAQSYYESLEFEQDSKETSFLWSHKRGPR